MTVFDTALRQIAKQSAEDNRQLAWLLKYSGAKQVYITGDPFTHRVDVRDDAGRVLYWREGGVEWLIPDTPTLYDLADRWEDE